MTNNNQFAWLALDDLGEPLRFFRYKHQAEDFRAATGAAIKPTGHKEPTRLDEYTRASEDCGPALF
jgi:hypothetical protein